jgi:hypothetical protein
MVTCVLSAALAVGSAAAPDAGSPADMSTTQIFADQNSQDRALEAATRRFRMQIYNTYRLNRTEFNRRRAAWEEIQARWREAGSPVAHKNVLLLWLHYAAYQSQANVRGPLPASPGFGKLAGVDRDLDAAHQLKNTDSPQILIPADLQGAVRESDLTPPRVERGAPQPADHGGEIPSVDVTTSEPTRRAASSVSSAAVAAHASDEIGIDVSELLARASGYQAGLQTIDAVLVGQQEMDTAEISALLDEVETLIGQRRDLMLYEKLVPPNEQSRLVSALAFPKATVAELGSRIAAQRARVEAHNVVDTTEPDLQALERLSKRLAVLNEK